MQVHLCTLLFSPSAVRLIRDCYSPSSPCIVHCRATQTLVGAIDHPSLSIDGKDKECMFCSQGGNLTICAGAGCTHAVHSRCAKNNGWPVKRTEDWLCHECSPQAIGEHSWQSDVDER